MTKNTKIIAIVNCGVTTFLEVGGTYFNGYCPLDKVDGIKIGIYLCKLNRLINKIKIESFEIR